MPKRFYLGNGQPWDLDRSDGGVHILPPYQREGEVGTWYKGTANAIYQKGPQRCPGGLPPPPGGGGRPGSAGRTPPLLLHLLGAGPLGFFRGGFFHGGLFRFGGLLRGGLFLRLGGGLLRSGLLLCLGIIRLFSSPSGGRGQSSRAPLGPSGPNSL